MPAPMRKLQQANLDSTLNALANAATRLERFNLIYAERFPELAKMVVQIEEKIKGAFIEVQGIREAL